MHISLNFAEASFISAIGFGQPLPNQFLFFFFFFINTIFMEREERREKEIDEIRLVKCTEEVCMGMSYQKILHILASSVIISFSLVSTA